MREGVLLIGASDSHSAAIRQELPGRAIEVASELPAIAEALKRLTAKGIHRVYPIETAGLDPAEIVSLIKERSGGAIATHGDALHPVRAQADRHGLVIVNTGDGKGKTTASLGMSLRALGHGMRVVILQFMKGSRASGELILNQTFGDRIEILPLGEGFTWEVPEKRNRMLAQDAWKRCEAAIRGGEYDLVICDEINIALSNGFLELAPLLAALSCRPPAVHVVLTGRNAPEALIEAADLVSEMRLVKHPYGKGVKAQPGVEF